MKQQSAGRRERYHSDGFALPRLGYYPKGHSSDNFRAWMLAQWWDEQALNTNNVLERPLESGSILALRKLL
jgi:hypothetical protein